MRTARKPASSDAPLRIAHFLAGPVRADGLNGVSTAVHQLTRGQSELGHQVAAFSLSTEPSAPGADVRVHAYDGPPRWVTVPGRLIDDLRAFAPDVVHLHSVYLPAKLGLARRLRQDGIPFAVTPHGALLPQNFRHRRYLKWPYRLLLERPHLNRAAFVHSLVDERYVREYGVDAPVVRVPNGIDPASLPERPDADALRRRVPALRGRRVYVFLGRLAVEAKGLDLLLRAAARAADRDPDFAIVLVGPDWRDGERELRRLADRLGLTDRVFFVGPVVGPAKFDLLAGADVFLHPSRWEGVPFAVLEAMASGLPALVSRAADPLGTIAARGLGLAVEPTVDAIAEALIRFAEMRSDELERRGRNARRVACTEFDWRTTAGRIVEAYREYAVGARPSEAAPLPESRSRSASGPTGAVSDGGGG